MTKLEIFKAELVKQYNVLFFQSTEYAHVCSRMTAEELADRMVNAFKDGTASKEGKGVKNACKALRIKHTYKAIQEYITEPNGNLENV